MTAGVAGAALVDALRLVAITDDLRDGIEGLTSRASAAARGGVTMVQLRLEDIDPRDLVAIARTLVEALPVPVIVNGRADVALAAGAAGVHVGTDEIPAAALRRVVPPGFIIGASLGTEKEVPDVLGADYVGIGPVFATASRPHASEAIGIEEFARLARLAGLPAIGIGGIDERTAGRVRDAGGAGVAVIRTIFASADPERAARVLSSAIGS